MRINYADFTEYPTRVSSYVEDCDEADRISAEIDAWIMPTCSWQEVKNSLGLNG